MFDTLITDRTITDFLRWQELRNKGLDNMTETERAEWETDLKGAYNASDLNRVGAVLNYLRDRLTEAGYLKGIEFEAVTTWEASDIPTTEQFTYYLKAVETIRNALSLYKTTPEAPNTLNSLDYTGANNIEKILIDVNELIDKMLSVRNYCGDIFSGEI